MELELDQARAGAVGREDGTGDRDHLGSAPDAPDAPDAPAPTADPALLATARRIRDLLPAEREDSRAQGATADDDPHLANDWGAGGPTVGAAVPSLGGHARTPPEPG